MRFRPSAWPISSSELSRALSTPRFSRNSVVRLMISSTVSIGSVVLPGTTLPHRNRPARELGQLLLEVRPLQRLDDRVEVALHHRRQVVEREPDAVVRDAVLREIVGADAFAAAAGADLAPALRGVLAPLLLLFLFQQARTQHRHGLRLVLLLGAAIRTIDHQPGRLVDDSHRRVRGVDALAARTAGPHDADLEILR